MANHATRSRARLRERPALPNTVVGCKAEKLSLQLDDKLRNIALRRDPSLKPLIVVDLFAGAGGASQGLLRALTFAGLTPDRLAELGYYLKLICINHWEIAIETIRRNIAFADMYNASIENWDPSQLLNGERAHLLIFAPECIAHSYAKGKGPIKDQSRTTAAWVLDWIKTQPHALYCENVWPWKDWGPLNSKGDPIQSRKGEYFNAFVNEIRDSGYKSFRYGKFCCANYGDPTTRERLFGTAWHDEYEAHTPFPAETHTEFPERFPHLQAWVPASACINFDLESDYITERDTIHAPTTIRRIRAGFERQYTAIDSPLLVEICNRVEPIAARAHAILNTRPSEAKRKAEAKALGKRVPKNTNKYRLTAAEKKDNKRILDEVRAETYEALRQAAEAPLAYLDPNDIPDEVMLAIEAIVGQHAGNAPRTVGEPLMAIEAKGAIGLAQAQICKANASETSAFNDAVQNPADPFNTIVAKDCRALSQPSLVVVRHGKDDVRVPESSYPFDTVTAKNDLGVAQPQITLAGPAILNLYSSNITEDGATASAATLPNEPVPTITAGGKHHGLAQRDMFAGPVITHCHGEKENEGNRTSTPSRPLGTVAAQGKQHGLAQSVIDLTYTGNKHGGTIVNQPMNTLLGVNHHALTQPTLIPQNSETPPQTAEEAPTPTVVAIARIGLADSTIIPQHTNAHPRSTSEEPVTTVMTEARIGLAQSAIISRNGTEGDRAPRPTDKPTFSITASGGGSLAEPKMKRSNNVIPLSEAFLTPNFGERPTQEPRTHAISKPAPAVTSHGAGMLVDKDFDANGNPLKIMFHFYIGTMKIWINIRYRMLHSSELKKAHSLDDVVFAGSEADAIRQIGNSIPARTAAAFIAHVLTPVFARMALPALRAA